MNITLNVSDQVGVQVNNMPMSDRDKFGEQALKEMLKKYQDSLSKAKTPTKQKGKWAKIAEDAHRESPLRGMSDELNKYSKEFRDNFAFKHDE